jgi:hypothetical protein
MVPPAAPGPTATAEPVTFCHASRLPSPSTTCDSCAAIPDPVSVDPVNSTDAPFAPTSTAVRAGVGVSGAVVSCVITVVLVAPFSSVVVRR